MARATSTSRSRTRDGCGAWICSNFSPTLLIRKTWKICSTSLSSATRTRAGNVDYHLPCATVSASCATVSVKRRTSSWLGNHQCGSLGNHAVSGAASFHEKGRSRRWSNDKRMCYLSTKTKGMRFVGKTASWKSGPAELRVAWRSLRACRFRLIRRACLVRCRSRRLRRRVLFPVLAVASGSLRKTPSPSG